MHARGWFIATATTAAAAVVMKVVVTVVAVLVVAVLVRSDGSCSSGPIYCHGRAED